MMQTATDYHTNTASQKGCRINWFEIVSGLCMVSLAASLSHMMQPAVIMRSGCLRVSLPVAETFSHLKSYAPHPWHRVLYSWPRSQKRFLRASAADRRQGPPVLCRSRWCAWWSCKSLRLGYIPRQAPYNTRTHARRPVGDAYHMIHACMPSRCGAVPHAPQLAALVMRMHSHRFSGQSRSDGLWRACGGQCDARR